MLRNTLILPESDAQLAGRMLRDAIEAVDTILMLVFGKDSRTGQIVKWADLLCNKTQMTPDYNPRKVVWIRKPDVQPIRAVLDPMGVSGTAVVVVLDFYDKVKATLEPGDDTMPLDLEIAFLKGGIIDGDE